MNETWGRRLFHAGAILLLLIGVVHSLSLFGSPTPANETEKQLLSLMNDYHFNLVGSSRSMANLMRGFSISFMVAAFGFALLDLTLRREPAQVLKRVALVNALWLATMTAVSLRYFFVLPTSFLVAALLLFVLAWFKLPTGSEEPSRKVQAVS